MVPKGNGVNGKLYRSDLSVVPLGIMAPAKLPKELNDFGRRVQLAMDQEGQLSQNAVGRAAGIPQGYLSRMMRETRGENTVNVRYMRNLARVLHVNFEWLVIGEGPMRRDGRETTAAEQAITTARSLGCREDAIATAWERNMDRESEMAVSDWADAIDAEARRLDRAGVPRPEVTAEKQAAIQRSKEQLVRTREALESSKQQLEKTAGPRRRTAG